MALIRKTCIIMYGQVLWIWGMGPNRGRSRCSSWKNLDHFDQPSMAVGIFNTKLQATCAIVDQMSSLPRHPLTSELMSPLGLGSVISQVFLVFRPLKKPSHAHCPVGNAVTPISPSHHLITCVAKVELHAGLFWWNEWLQPKSIL